ncbi:MAG: hypothetical protein ACXQT4_05205 [Methanotrichaceae archaeon]
MFNVTASYTLMRQGFRGLNTLYRRRQCRSAANITIEPASDNLFWMVVTSILQAASDILFAKQ